jgi:hypothetical protein
VAVTAWPLIDVAGSTARTAVEALRVGWGADSPLSAPSPSTASVVVLDKAPGYPFASLGADLIGQPVVLSWDHDSPSFPGATPIFRGRITDATVRPQHPRRPEAGMRVALSCASREAELGNVIAAKGPAPFPAELMTQRRNRIVGMLPAGLLTGGAQLLADSTGTNYTVGQHDVAGSDALSLLRGVYASAGYFMRYDAQFDQMTYLAPTRFAADGSGRSYTADLGTVRNTDPPAPLWRVRSLLGGLHMLRAEQVAYDGELSAPLDSRITRVELTYKNAAASYQDTTVSVAVGPAGDEASIGRRVFSVETVLANAADAAAIAAVWAALAGAEGRRRRFTEPLTFSTARNGGGFDEWGQADALLSTRPGWGLFLAGSWLTRLGFRPHVYPVGGTITYTPAGWEVAVIPGGLTAAGTLAPVTGGAAPAGLRLADIDPAVTLGDLAYVESYGT